MPKYMFQLFLEMKTFTSLNKFFTFSLMLYLGNIKTTRHN